MPKTDVVRPMQDRVKESIFAILSEKCVGSRVLDLFSGSGSIGLEALSRGAKEVIFVEHNPICITTIKKNLESIGVRQDVQVLRLDSLVAIKKLGKEKAAFDIIFLDPPYGMGLIEKSLIALDKYAIISPSGVVISHHFKKELMPQSIGKLHLYRQTSYGDKIISFYSLLKNNKPGE